MDWFKVVVVSVLCFAVTNARPKTRISINVDDYLRKFHYLGAGNPDPKIQELARTNMTMARQVGLSMFQKKWDMDVTGVADQDTMRKMNTPRCGMPDIEVMEDMPNMDTFMGKIREKIRNRRYMLHGSSWDRDQLYYRISQYTPDLPQVQVDSEIRRAFKIWSDVTPLDFIQVYREDDHIDIDIRFAPIVHGDGFDFDGIGGTLAHAFYPQYGGDAHFDDSETWTIATNQGINLFQVAAHEFGHSLGLRHSDQLGALMYPFYGGYVPDFTLPHDDRAGIQAIYGPAVENPPTDAPTLPTVRPTMPPGMPDMCNDGVIDAITTQIINGESITHVFRGLYYMKFNPQGLVSGYPKLISTEWPGVTSVDAALTMEWEELNTNDWRYRMVTYLFSGDRYYKYVNMALMHSGYVSSDWGLPSHLDAVFQWSANGRIYAIKDDKYYTIRSISSKETDGPPRPLSNWGIDRVDATFMATNGDNMRDTIFFKGQQYYRVDTSTQMVGSGQSTPERWLGCESDADDNILFPGHNL